jgi:hypothetical protein
LGAHLLDLQANIIETNAQLNKSIQAARSLLLLEGGDLRGRFAGMKQLETSSLEERIDIKSLTVELQRVRPTPTKLPQVSELEQYICVVRALRKRFQIVPVCTGQVTGVLKHISELNF